jgi:transcriptional regulator GlxA family with amidase domain
MDRRIADPLDLDQMAAQAGFSKFYFARAFKDAYVETPANYLTRRRVKRAMMRDDSGNLIKSHPASVSPSALRATPRP